MRVKNTETRGEYAVHNAEINAYDWTLIRKIGIGTYARIARVGDDEPQDETLVLEEHAEPWNRKLIDDMSVIELAAWAKREIDEILTDRREAREC